jgi:cobalt-zinc-cadmium efflux system membrane fusion protein
MFGGGSSAKSSLQEAEASLREARVRLFNDQQALAGLGLPVLPDELEKLSDEKQRDRLRLLGVPEKLTKELTKGRNPATLTANLLPLVAPFDCKVVERNAATGEAVQAGQAKPLFVVGDVCQLHVDLDVDPEYAALVKLEQEVVFRPNDGGPDATAHVAHISPEVNAKTRRVQIHARMPNKDGRMRPNTFGTGRIVVAERSGAVVVPAEAVQSDGQDSLVFVRVSPTAFEARAVRPGLRQGGLVEVSGVREGEEVVTTGGHLLKSELQKDRIAGGD